VRIPRTEASAVLQIAVSKENHCYCGDEMSRSRHVSLNEDLNNSKVKVKKSIIITNFSRKRLSPLSIIYRIFDQRREQLQKTSIFERQTMSITSDNVNCN
jgi:hypothetical protein